MLLVKVGKRVERIYDLSLRSYFSVPLNHIAFLLMFSVVILIFSQYFGSSCGIFCSSFHLR